MKFYLINMWEWIPEASFLFFKLEVHYNSLMIDFEIMGISIIGLFLLYKRDIGMDILGISFGFSTIPYGISLKPPK
jgi:hypothetical protein